MRQNLWPNALAKLCGAALADLNEQAQDRLERMIDQMKATEGITEALKASDPMAWVQHMNNIRARAEEIVQEEMICV